VLPAAQAVFETVALSEDEARCLLEGGVASLAALQRVSRRTVHRRLALLGTSPRVLITGLRRERTPRLLKEGIPLAEIAARLGFASTQTLARFVRREFGVTATELRKDRALPSITHRRP